MRYLSVAETAKKWDISERSVRNYCAHGRVPGAFLTGKTWNVPEDAAKPLRANQKENKPKTLLSILQEEKKSKYSGGIYHKTQIDLTYNSNHMEGSRLTYDPVSYTHLDVYKRQAILIWLCISVYFKGDSGADASVPDRSLYFFLRLYRTGNTDPAPCLLYTSQVYTFLTACAVYPRGRKSA